MTKKVKGRKKESHRDGKDKKIRGIDRRPSIPTLSTAEREEGKQKREIIKDTTS